MKHSVCTSLQKLAAVPSKEKSALLVLGPNCNAWSQLATPAPPHAHLTSNLTDAKFCPQILLLPISRK